MNFDAHADIWTDVTHHYLDGESDILRKYHYERFKKGQIEGGIVGLNSFNEKVIK